MAINKFPDGGIIDGGLRGLRGLRGGISDISPNLGLPIKTQSSGTIAYSLSGANGSYAITGKNATFNYVAGSSSVAYSLSGAFGTYTLTGQSASFKVSHTLSAAFGSYALSLKTASFKVAHTLSASNGSYALTPQTATFKVIHTLTANNGSYSVNGQTATFNYVAGSGSTAYSLSGAFGTYALSGQSATFTPVHNYTLSGAFGSYSFAGQPALFKVAHSLTANNGAYAFSGKTATFNYVAGSGTHNYTLTADYGAYSLIGGVATFAFSGQVDEQTGAPPYSVKKKHIVRIGNEIRVYGSKQEAINALQDDDLDDVGEINALIDLDIAEKEEVQPQAQEIALQPTYDLTAMLETLKANAIAEQLLNERKYQALLAMYEQFIDEEEIELLLLA